MRAFSERPFWRSEAFFLAFSCLALESLIMASKSRKNRLSRAISRSRMISRSRANSSGIANRAVITSSVSIAVTVAASGSANTSGAALSKTFAHSWIRGFLGGSSAIGSHSGARTARGCSASSQLALNCSTRSVVSPCSGISGHRAAKSSIFTLCATPCRALAVSAAKAFPVSSLSGMIATYLPLSASVY